VFFFFLNSPNQNPSAALQNYLLSLDKVPKLEPDELM